jgi:excisionase family DNA binding protein
MNRVLTTGQVARVFSVNINTVIKWFDEGKLEGFRLPRSNERRIYRESVQAFMREHGIRNELLQEFDQEEDGKRAKKKSRPPQAIAPADGPEQRVFPRVPVELRGTVRAVDGDRVLSIVTVRNLSLGGAYITGFRLDGGVIPTEFRLDVDGEARNPLEGTCQLIHLRRETDSVSFGCRFTRVDPSTLRTFLADA